MKTVPIHRPDTLRIIFDRGLIGTYHDWCEPFNTYPRTYDLLHSSFLFGNLTQRYATRFLHSQVLNVQGLNIHGSLYRCDIVDVVIEMDRILRPDGWVLIQDTKEMIKKLRSIFNSLHWATTVHEQEFLVGKKSFWRPS